MILNYTKNQILILEIFFNKPELALHMRGIAQILKKEPGVFQRDINALSKEGILESHADGNRRIFKLNKKYPLYKELKSIFFKTVGLEGVLKGELNKIKRINEAYIYGSFARGEEKEASDIDILIIGSVPENDLIDLFNRLEKKFDREISYVLLTPVEYESKIKAKNSFLINVLKNKKIRLI